jgi:thioredoxin reductase (NADPH)
MNRLDVKNMYDVIIIGSGPAGLTAAIYSSRAKLTVLLIAGIERGGQLMLTTDVENYPGFKEGILGPELIEQMWKQAERFGTAFIYDNVTKVDFSSRPFKIWTEDEEFEGRAIIVATGASAKWLGLESEARLRGRGVSICATCDAPFFRDKTAIVVGGGDWALEEALALSKFVTNVHIVHRRDQLRASKILQERVFADPKIEIIWSTVVQEILGKDRVEGVRLKQTNSRKELVQDCDAVFIAIGHTPNSSIFKDQIELNERGFVVVHDQTNTSVPGVFAAGDVQDYRYRQAITAAGSGCKAALDTEKYLSS